MQKQAVIKKSRKVSGLLVFLIVMGILSSLCLLMLFPPAFIPFIVAFAGKAIAYLATYGISKIIIAIVAGASGFISIAPMALQTINSFQKLFQTFVKGKAKAAVNEGEKEAPEVTSIIEPAFQPNINETSPDQTTAQPKAANNENKTVLNNETTLSQPETASNNAQTASLSGKGLSDQNIIAQLAQKATELDKKLAELRAQGEELLKLEAQQLTAVRGTRITLAYFNESFQTIAQDIIHEIEKAYRSGARALHPDKYPLAVYSEVIIITANNLFQELNNKAERIKLDLAKRCEELAREVWQNQSQRRNFNSADLEKTRNDLKDLTESLTKLAEEIAEMGSKIDKLHEAVERVSEEQQSIAKQVEALRIEVKEECLEQQAARQEKQKERQEKQKEHQQLEAKFENLLEIYNSKLVSNMLLTKQPSNLSNMGFLSGSSEALIENQQVAREVSVEQAEYLSSLNK